jgi:hypothetical protein
MAVGNDRATMAEIQADAMAAQFRKKSGTDFDFIAAGAEWHRNDTHDGRIRTAVGMSKICHRRLAERFS